MTDLLPLATVPTDEDEAFADRICKRVEEVSLTNASVEITAAITLARRVGRLEGMKLARTDGRSLVTARGPFHMEWAGRVDVRSSRPQTPSNTSC